MMTVADPLSAGLITISVFCFKDCKASNSSSVTFLMVCFGIFNFRMSSWILSMTFRIFLSIFLSEGVHSDLAVNFSL